MHEEVSSQFYRGFFLQALAEKGMRKGGNGEKERRAQLSSLAMSHSESADNEGQPECETGDSVESFVSSFTYFRNTNSE